MINEDTSPGTCKRACWAFVVHLGAFKSQLVATIAHVINIDININIKI